MMDRRNTSGASLDVVSTPSIHDHLLVDEHNAKFDSVTGPTDGKPLLQRVFVAARPGWFAYMKRHATLQELSGAFGDIGLFLPLLTALAIGRVGGKPQIEIGPALFFAGVFTAGLSLYFAVPIPVQPMKTISAVAIAEKYSNEEILAAGILSGVTMFLLAATNLITVVVKWVPMAVVRGIQLGVGISIMMSGFKAAYVAKLKLTKATAITPFSGKEVATEIQWWGIDSVLVSIILGLLCVVFLNSRKVPIGLVVFVYGMLVAVYQYSTLKHDYNLPSLRLGPDFVAPVVPSWHAFQTAFVYLFLPQLPLSLLNSVIAVEKLATDLFPKHHEPAGVRRICFSIAGGNLLFSWFGMLPVCHGAGGLASQYTFGARSSLSMVFLGLFKLSFSLLFGSTCLVLLQKGIFPQSVLGVMLIFSGLSLAAVGLKIDHTNRQDTLLLLLTAAGCLGINTGAGFLIGFGVYCFLRVLQLVGVEHYQRNYCGEAATIYWNH
jgi:xanthine/uracil/vitamin C permease (AzgA family)